MGRQSTAAVKMIPPARYAPSTAEDPKNFGNVLIGKSAVNHGDANAIEKMAAKMSFFIVPPDCY